MGFFKTFLTLKVKDPAGIQPGSSEDPARIQPGSSRGSSEDPAGIQPGTSDGSSRDPAGIQRGSSDNPAFDKKILLILLKLIQSMLSQSKWDSPDNSIS